MKIYLSRFVSRDTASNLQRVAEESEQAARAGARLCVFPESFLHGYTRSVDPVEVRRRFAAVSAQHPDISFVFGSFTEERRNRMTVWLRGQEQARYDKVHLFAPNAEQELWDPGDRYVALKLGDWTLGLVNCNDIRFPEQARALRLQARVDALVVIAWWPWRRDHVLATLLRARAIENGVFVLAAAQGGLHEDGRGTWGHSMIIDPWGRILAEAPGDAPGVVMADLNLEEVAATRQAIPSLKNERAFAPPPGQGAGA